MRGILISTLLIQAYMHERERAYERHSHKHANTSIYERAYERDFHKHANTSIYMSGLMRGILITTLIQACIFVRVHFKHATNTSIYI